VKPFLWETRKEREVKGCGRGRVDKTLVEGEWVQEAAESHVVEVEQGSRGRERTCEQGKVPNQDEETCMV